MENWSQWGGLRLVWFSDSAKCSRRMMMPEEKSKMYELIGRAIADPDFRAALAADPEAAVKEAGYELTEEEIAGLREIDLQAAVEELGGRMTLGPMISPPFL